jgi:2-polyprenyl-3-methyl-5-hydroxy-6-metoxy-1,4-benzoquinol methylase
LGKTIDIQTIGTHLKKQIKVQDKAAEIEAGCISPEGAWLDDAQGYKVRNTHLQLLELIPSAGWRILDAGCGPGTYGIMLAQEGNEVVGIEISLDAVHVANKRAEEKGVNFSAHVGDLEKLPFKDNSFDICFCGWVLHHFPDIDAAVAELVRVLKPGGKMALVEPNESNSVIRFSRFIEDLPLLRGWILREGWDTQNRTITMHHQYINSLSKHRITDIKLGSCFPGGLPPLPPRSQKGFGNLLSLLSIKIMFQVRRLLLIYAFKLLPRPLNGAELHITGIKSQQDILR